MSMHPRQASHCTNLANVTREVVQGIGGRSTHVERERKPRHAGSCRMTEQRPRVTLIVPHYNGKECLQRLLPKVDSQTYRDFEVLIIDDCSTDESAVLFIRDYVRDKPYMHLVRNPENMRFIRTCNKGISLAKGEYICLLNQDTEITDAFVEKNVMMMDSDASIGALSSVIIDQNGRNWFSGGRYRCGCPSNSTDDFEGIRTVDYVAGTAPFYRIDVFRKIGLFDANLVMYHEDVEFGLRMTRNTDYRLCIFPDKLVTHFLVPSMPRSGLCYYLNRNLVLLSKEYAAKCLPIVLLRILLREVAVRLALAPLALLALKPSLSLRWIRFASASARGGIDGLTARQQSRRDSLGKVDSALSSTSEPRCEDTRNGGAS